MKFIVTGGNRGLGKKICEETGGISLSRSSGFDITEMDCREKIGMLSLDADVFVNNAFDGPPSEPYGDFAQARLLQTIFRLWSEKRKPGYIVNIGSIASLYTIKKYDSFSTYKIAKLALDQASLACTRAFFAGEVPFRTSLVRFGRLDTPQSRSKPSWGGKGHDLAHITGSLLSLVNSPPDTCAYSLDFDTKTE